MILTRGYSRSADVCVPPRRSRSLTCRSARRRARFCRSPPVSRIPAGASRRFRLAVLSSRVCLRRHKLAAHVSVSQQLQEGKSSPLSTGRNLQQDHAGTGWIKELFVVQAPSPLIYQRSKVRKTPENSSASYQPKCHAETSLGDGNYCKQIEFMDSVAQKSRRKLTRRTSTSGGLSELFIQSNIPTLLRFPIIGHKC